MEAENRAIWNRLWMTMTLGDRAAWYVAIRNGAVDLQ